MTLESTHRIPAARAVIDDQTHPATDLHPPRHSPAEADQTEQLAHPNLGRRMSARIDLGPGDEIGCYRILESLGEGGMGSVFLAEQREPMQRRVAIKVVKLGMDTRDVLARFEAERQAIALMRHPNVAAVLDAGATRSGRPYFVMEYVPGIPITDYCDARRLSIRERLELFRQACEAIQHAHHKGIIHRDIKPGNVLVTESDGRPLVKVIDFGVAKSTQQKLAAETIYTRMGVFIGTPNYTSPEQSRTGFMDVDTRTDVYSLGVMLYELLVGDLPFGSGSFSGKSLQEIQRIIQETEPPRLTSKFDALGAERERIAAQRGIDAARLRRQLRGDIAWVALRAMEKDRARRYPSAFALAEDVRRFMVDQPVEARPPSALYRAAKFTRRHTLGVAVSLFALLGLVVTSTAMTGLYLKARSAEELARQEARTAQQVASFLTGLFNEADPNRNRGLDISARALLDRGADRIRSELRDEPLLRARLMRTISGIYEELGLLAPAEELGREALDLDQGLLEPQAGPLALSLTNLANVYESQGRSKAALTLYRRALAIQRENLGPDHPDVAALLSDIGGILEQQERYDQAIEYLERALDIDRKALGPSDPRVASDLNDLGNIHDSLGDPGTALDYYHRSLAINQRVLPADHPDIGGDLSDLGGAYVNLGQFEAGIDAQQRALDILERAFGPAHPDVAEALHGLGEAYLESGEPERAVSPLGRALAIRESTLGRQHEESLESAALLAEALAAVGAVPRAESLLADRGADSRSTTEPPDGSDPASDSED